MAVKQLGNSGTAPDGSMYVTMTDGAGNLSSVGAGSSGTVTTTTNTEGTKTTYSIAHTGIGPAAAATDIWALTGSASKTVRVTRISITGQATAATYAGFALIKRSTANTGGTSSASTIVPHDSTNAVATATPLAYSANPTTGAVVGTVRAQQTLLVAGGSPVASIPIVWDFTTRNSQGIVLRGTSQVLAINLGASTIAGAVVALDVEWTEE